VDTSVAPKDLRDHLLARGRQIVQLHDVAQLTGLPPKAAADAMTRLRRAGLFFAPAPGLYVAIPPQYLTWGAVPAVDFVDPTMAKLGRGYYVALLSAAELHGAAHQRPQVFQVMVDRALKDRDFGRVRLRFYTNSRLAQVPTTSRNTATGHIRLSTPEATALDMAARPNDAGGLSNVATVVGELAQDGRLHGPALASAAALYPQAVARRLGWLLDRITEHADTSALSAALAETVREGAPRRPVDLLDPSGPRRGPADLRWGVVVNTDVEPDL